MHELKGTGDLDPFEQVSHRFVSGIDDESIGYAAESLKQLRAEVMRRAARLKKPCTAALCPDKKVTREIASQAQPEAAPADVRDRRVPEPVRPPEVRQAGRRGRDVHHQDRPGARRVPDPGHAAAGQGVAADRRLRQRVDPVLPEGRRPGRERHDPRHVGVQERRPGDHVPAEDRRRARLPQGRGEHAPGRADLLPEQRRHRAGGQARPGAPRGGRDAVRRGARRGRQPRRSATSWPTCSRCSAAPPGCTGSRSPTGSPQRFPERWADASGDAVSRRAARARGVPSVVVVMDGTRARGCRRADVESARQASRDPLPASHLCAQPWPARTRNPAVTGNASPAAADLRDNR